MNSEISKDVNFVDEDLNLLSNYTDNFAKIVEYVDKQDINSYINFIVDQLFAANKYFNDQEPWKKKGDKKRLNTIVYTSLEFIRKVTILLYPIIPNTAQKTMKIFTEIKLFSDLSSVLGTSLLQVTATTSRSCHFAKDKTITDKPKKEERLLVDHLSEKIFDGRRPFLSSTLI